MAIQLDIFQVKRNVVRETQRNLGGILHTHFCARPDDIDP